MQRYVIWLFKGEECVYRVGLAAKSKSRAETFARLYAAQGGITEFNQLITLKTNSNRFQVFTNQRSGSIVDLQPALKHLDYDKMKLVAKSLVSDIAA